MRFIKLLFIQLGFHPDYPDVSTLAATYCDGIYYVASYLKERLPKARVDLCQMFWGEKPADFALETYDYILVSCLATHFWSNIPVLESLRQKKKPECKIIMGGPHATFAPYEAIRYADYLILGEGEVACLELLTALETGRDLDQVGNLCRLAPNGALAINDFCRQAVPDIAIHPSFMERAPRLHWATVSMSRGCPYNCSFCYAIRVHGRKFQTKSIAAIAAELESLHACTGCARFYVTDLNFTTRADFCREVAAAVKDRGYHFIAMSRVEIADDVRFITDLKAAGFREFCVGIESENPDVLRAFNKRVNTSLQTERLLTFAENDIYIHSAIIFGHEAQDEAAILRTARWCAEARVVHPTFVCLAEYPFQELLFGSRQDIEDHRIIMETPVYQHYSFVGIFPRHMRPSRLQELIWQSYPVFFQRAYEIETRPPRRMRLKAYERSVEKSYVGFQRHIRFLREIEKPYYTPAGVLREERLKADFEARAGALRDWLKTTVYRDRNFKRAFAA